MREADRRFAVGLARAFGGAIFFSLPLLMTMEMWWLGFHMDRVRLAGLMLALLPLLVALDHYSGFRETTTWTEDAVDALVAYGVGFLASTAVLALFGVLRPGMPVDELVGKIALQAVPASLGAVLANSQLRAADDPEDGEEEGTAEERRRHAHYPAQLFFMTTGALFLAFNVAPTEEILLISYKMTHWHGLALAVTTLLMMHAFVYSVGFRGTPEIPEDSSRWAIFLLFTVVGYALALIVSALVLWTFGRFEGEPAALILMQSVVLGFASGLGAAAARLIL